MRIAHVVPAYPPYRSGMSQVVYEYTERLRARHHSVHVFTPRYRHVDGDPDYVHRLPAMLEVGNAAFTPALYRLDGFDVVHLHYPFFGGAEPVVVRHVIKRDSALVISYYMDAIADGARGVFFELHRRILLPRILSHADRVLVSSLDYARSSALAQVKGILERVEVHPYGVDLDRFHPGEEPALRSSLGIGGDVPIVLFVGGLDPAHHFKGVPTLFEALKGLSALPWHLVVVGDGTLRASFEALASARQIARQVHFAGTVGSEVLGQYYRLADLHVLPSTGPSEAFGLVALEASASGIPTVASDLPGVRTVVLDQQTGLCVPPGDVSKLGDGVRLLLEREDLRRQLGHQARKRAESEFSWEPLISRLELTYRDVVESFAGRSKTSRYQIDRT